MDAQSARISVDYLFHFFFSLVEQQGVYSHDRSGGIVMTYWFFNTIQSIYIIFTARVCFPCGQIIATHTLCFWSFRPLLMSWILCCLKGCKTKSLNSFLFHIKVSLEASYNHMNWLIEAVILLSLFISSRNSQAYFEKRYFMCRIHLYCPEGLALKSVKAILKYFSCGSLDSKVLNGAMLLSILLLK